MLREKWAMWNATLSMGRNATLSTSRNVAPSIQRNATRFQPADWWKRPSWSAPGTVMERRPARTRTSTWQSVTLRRNAKGRPMRNATGCPTKSAKISRTRFATMFWRRRQTSTHPIWTAKPSKRKFAIDQMLCKYTNLRLVISERSSLHADVLSLYIFRFSLSSLGISWEYLGRFLADILGIFWWYLEDILGISSLFLE